MKKNEGHFEDTHILLPLPPLEATHQADENTKIEMDIYVRFMRCLRNVSNLRRETAILTSLQFVSDMMELPIKEVVSILVNLGLRAPRAAFPESYVKLIDQSTMQDIYDVRCTRFPLRDLRQHWYAIGKDKFLNFGMA